MSYLYLPNGVPDFSKAVISIWFRIPKATLEACADRALAHFNANAAATQAEGHPNSYVMPRMNGIVPLLTFGPMFEGYKIKTENGASYPYTVDYATYIEGAGYKVYPWTETYSTTHGPVFTRMSKVLSNPSFIGIYTTWELDENNNKTGRLETVLRVRIQMEDEGSGSWVYTRPYSTISNHTILMSSIGAGAAQDTAWQSAFTACVRGSLYPGGNRVMTATTLDDTGLVAKQNGPESLGGGFFIREEDGYYNTIKPDQWHHVLISFDLDHGMVGSGAKYIFSRPDCSVGASRPERTGGLAGGNSSVGDPCKMWIALDDENDVNVSGLLGGANHDEPSYGIGPNDITTDNSWNAATGILSETVYEKSWGVTGLIHVRNGAAGFGVPTFSYTPGKLPCEGHPFGIPAQPALVDHIYRIELAEFQLFTGVTLDTGITSNRRVFVDDEGKPVNPTKMTEEDKRWPGEKLLGKKPEILLHGSGNWKTGKNTGTLGADIDTAGNIEIKPGGAGQFTPVARIEKFKPEPALEEDTA